MPAPPPVAQLDADTFAARIAADTAPEPAWRALLAAWELPTSDEDVAIAMRCAPTLAADAWCLHGHATLDALTTIGRPVLLSLRDEGRSAWALLLGSDATRVRLRFAEGVADVPRVELAQRWNGDYAALWRASPDLPAPDGAALLRFQAAHGLAADGVVGPETRFALAAQAPGPHLLPELR